MRGYGFIVQGPGVLKIDSKSGKIEKKKIQKFFFGVIND